ncbi:MAG: hypothetical protein OXU37_02865 [Thaumarchaeota archaeon]|nr:hypothetical protein [Nitrososphaerota archaeon]MDD9813202.1 hypothetical protein [Nitrososphaerota archaeon]MDD9842943.1 hypothetical protein [Nitrososphaerota archaeon]
MGTVRPQDVVGAHAGAAYEVVLGGAPHAVASARMEGDAGGGWPTLVAAMRDAASLPPLSGAMLGPSGEFAEIEVRAAGPVPMRLAANLTSYSQRSGGVELTLRIVGAARA